MCSFYEVLVEMRYEVSREVHGRGLYGMGTLDVRDLAEVAPGRRVKRFCGVIRGGRGSLRRGHARKNELRGVRGLRAKEQQLVGFDAGACTRS